MISLGGDGTVVLGWVGWGMSGRRGCCLGTESGTTVSLHVCHFGSSGGARVAVHFTLELHAPVDFTGRAVFQFGAVSGGGVAGRIFCCGYSDEVPLWTRGPDISAVPLRRTRTRATKETRPYWVHR